LHINFHLVNSNLGASLFKKIGSVVFATRKPLTSFAPGFFPVHTVWRCDLAPGRYRDAPGARRFAQRNVLSREYRNTRVSRMGEESVATITISSCIISPIKNEQSPRQSRGLIYGPSFIPRSGLRRLFSYCVLQFHYIQKLRTHQISFYKPVVFLILFLLPYIEKLLLDAYGHWNNSKNALKNPFHKKQAL
jgi:hypothetical protein